MRLVALTLFVGCLTSTLILSDANPLSAAAVAGSGGQTFQGLKENTPLNQLFVTENGIQTDIIKDDFLLRPVLNEALGFEGLQMQVMTSS